LEKWASFDNHTNLRTGTWSARRFWWQWFLQ
jgi:hypothetical protein